MTFMSFIMSKMSFGSKIYRSGHFLRVKKASNLSPFSYLMASLSRVLGMKKIVACVTSPTRNLSLLREIIYLRLSQDNSKSQWIARGNIALNDEL
ncbi:hypothetical protein TNIN_272461 [Trichonephila inaurata madagascariensis]|uniref:Uncharacterized protein n=1 Tax=Trichonephila inaurata madagascariensis TaxID=2747483 RepID=A0A8X6YMU7_9ARAC|nr:hypothetical protein TNIN_272461 [Trichonephila inaurata madagascariensis]